MNEPLQRIRNKCEQYINCDRIGIEEFHAVLNVIDIAAAEAQDDLRMAWKGLEELKKGGKS